MAEEEISMLPKARFSHQLCSLRRTKERSRL